MSLTKEDGREYKKIVLMASGGQMLFELKRKIEKEFGELYPAEPPFVVAKLQDRNGFAMRGNSKVNEVLSNGDLLFAAEANEDPHGGKDSREHILLLANMQK